MYAIFVLNIKPVYYVNILTLIGQKLQETQYIYQKLFFYTEIYQSLQKYVQFTYCFNLFHI